MRKALSLIKRPLGFIKYIIKTKSSYIIWLRHQLTKICSRSYIAAPHCSHNQTNTVTVEHQTKNEKAFESQAGPIKSIFSAPLQSTSLQYHYKLQHGTPHPHPQTALNFKRETQTLSQTATTSQSINWSIRNCFTSRKQFLLMASVTVWAGIINWKFILLWMGKHSCH